MTLQESIKNAFAWRKMPECIIDSGNINQHDSDVDDALWFTGRDRDTISREEWESHEAGISYFHKDAYAYYLPSLLGYAVDCPNEKFSPFNRLIVDMDVPLNIDDMNPVTASQLLGMKNEEYDVLKECIVYLSEFSAYDIPRYHGPHDRLGRAFDMIDLIQENSNDACE